VKETKFLYTLQNDPLLTYYANTGKTALKLWEWCFGAAAVAALGGGVGLAGDTTLVIAYVATFTVVVFIYVNKLQQDIALSNPWGSRFPWVGQTNKPPFGGFDLFGVPTGIRTQVTALKER
jgi:hypothetical protein